MWIEWKWFDHAPKITIRPTMSWWRERSPRSIGLSAGAIRCATADGVILALKGSSASDELAAAARQLDAAQLDAEVLRVRVHPDANRRR